MVLRGSLEKQFLIKSSFYGWYGSDTREQDHRGWTDRQTSVSNSASPYRLAAKSSGMLLNTGTFLLRLLAWGYRHNMKLRSLLEHEPGAPPPAWAAAGVTGLTESETVLTGTPLWELTLLQKHFHSHVSQATAAVALIPPQGRACTPSAMPPPPLQTTCSVYAVNSTLWLHPSRKACESP